MGCDYGRSRAADQRITCPRLPAPDAVEEDDQEPSGLGPAHFYAHSPVRMPQVGDPRRVPLPGPRAAPWEVRVQARAFESRRTPSAETGRRRAKGSERGRVGRARTPYELPHNRTAAPATSATLVEPEPLTGLGGHSDRRPIRAAARICPAHHISATRFTCKLAIAN